MPRTVTANEIGHPKDLNLRPWYFTWSLLSRSFPPGCRTVKTSDTLIPGLRTLAATVGTNISIALVNDSDTPQQLKVNVPGCTAVSGLKQYNYFPDDHTVDQDGFPAPKSILLIADLSAGLAIDLPGRSVVILTSVP